MCKISASDTLKLYRHLYRLCASFSKTETLYFRDASDNTDIFLRFDMKGAAIRALNKWLRDTKTDVSSQVPVGTDVQSHSLPLPDMPSSMAFTRSALLDCVKRNFRKDSSKVESFGPQQQDVAREVLGFRGLCLGVFLDSQINLHRMSSITTTSFQALLPAEAQDIMDDDRQQHNSVREPGSKAAKGGTLGLTHGSHGHSDMSSAGPDRTPQPEEITTAQRQVQSSVTDSVNEHDLQHLQQRLESVQLVYKGRNPLVSSANEFEALCMSAISSREVPKKVDVATGASDEYLIPKVARLRIHAVPFPVRTGDEGESGVVRGSGEDERMLFHNQLIIENIGETAVQLMGRWHNVTAPWESTAFGDRGRPHGHPTEGVLLMPAETVMEQQAMQIHGREGEITGGFLCRVLPMDIAVDIAKLYTPTKLKLAGPVSMQSLDPDTYFLAEFGPCKIRSAQAIEGQFAQKLAAATENSDENSEDLSDDEQSSANEDETVIEVFADK